MTKGVSKLARLHPAPEELAEIIRLANLVPPDEPLKDLSEYIRGHLTDEDQHADEVHAALEKQFSRPRMENLARYIWTKPVPKVQLLGPDLPASRKQKTEFGYTFYLREWSSAFVGVPRRKSRSKLRRIFEKELPNSSPASVKEKTELGYVLYLRDALNEYEFVRQSRDNLRPQATLAGWAFRRWTDWEPSAMALTPSTNTSWPQNCRIEPRYWLG